MPFSILRTIPGPIVLLAAICGLWLGTSKASKAAASPLLELVGDAGGMGGLQAGNLASGSGAAYFNPALLVDTPAGSSFGLLTLSQRVGINVDSRQGAQAAVPAQIALAKRANGDDLSLYPAPTAILQHGRRQTQTLSAFAPRPRQQAGTGKSTLAYMLTGTVVKLFEDHVAIGLQGLLPVDHFLRMRAFYNDEREQYFSNSLHPEMYADRLLAISMAFGVGVKLGETLSVGAGTTFVLKTSVNAEAYVTDPKQLDNLLLNVDTPVELGFAPHFGVRFRPDRRLNLTANVHAPQQLLLESTYAFLQPDLSRTRASRTFTLDYVPWRVALGAAWDVVHETDHTLTLAGTAQYADWSAYTDRHGEKPSPRYSWKDTFTPTVGVRYRWDQLTTALDATFASTPVPLQTGRSNYVDNDRLGGRLGTEVAFEVLGTELKLGGHLQAHRLLPRYQRKVPADGSADLVRDEVPDDAQVDGLPLQGAAGLQTNNPGWPGFESKGWMLGASLYLTIAL